MIIQKRKVAGYWQFSLVEGDKRWYVSNRYDWWELKPDESDAFWFRTRLGGYYAARKIINRVKFQDQMEFDRNNVGWT